MRKFFLLLLVLFFPLKAFAEDVTFDSLKNWLDFSCVDFRVRGICIKHKHGRIKIGLKISYYLPVALVEVPPSPYRTAVAPLRPVLRASEPAIDKLVSAIPLFSSGYEFGGNIEDVEDTYYREAHVFSFPWIANPVLQLLPLACGRPYVPYFLWFSETDPLDWRLGMKDYLGQIRALPAKLNRLRNAITSYSSVATSPTNSIKNLVTRIMRDVSDFFKSLKSIKADVSDWKALLSKAQGVADRLEKAIPDGGWGSKTPHVGYVHDVSSTIAYHLMAVRALDLSFPLKPRWGVDKFQMVLPVQTGCYKLGSDRIRTETGKMLRGDTPVWIYWYRFNCCVF